jgi:hypothetical protein
MQNLTVHGKRLDTFTRAYLEAAFWTQEDDEELKPLGIIDMAPGALQLVITQCVEFQQMNADDLQDWADEQAGHDFWLTRNRHGAGFWDRDLGTKESRQRLTNAAHQYGEVSLVVGDDGMVYQE